MTLSRSAEGGLEQIVGPEGTHQPGFFPVRTFQDPEDRRFQIVVNQGPGNPIQPFEGFPVPIQKTFHRFMEVRLDKGDSTVSKPENKKVNGSLDSGDLGNGCPPIHLPHLAGIGLQRDKSLRYLAAKLLNTFPDRAFASRKLMFLHQAGIDPPGCMALFFGTLLVFPEPLLDDCLDWSDDRSRLLSSQSVPGNLRHRNRFPDSRPVDAKMPCNVAD